MYQVYTGVKVVDAELERHDMAGVVVSASPDGTPISVKFDDGVVEEFELDQLVGL
jgi:hypothetical protein